MYKSLKQYCCKIVSFTPSELQLIDLFFKPLTLNKKKFLLEGGGVCDFIAFISQGVIRHFHVKDGVEKTCDISFENNWVTDFYSFTKGSPSIMNLQALHTTTLLIIRKEDLTKLYKTCNKYETFGRLMAEQVAQRATEIAMSLSSEKPEERYMNLMGKNPDLLQRIPQKYIANYLGISAESLSRIRKRMSKRKS